MNVFASDRITPDRIKFPKGMDKLNWVVTKTYSEFCKAIEDSTKLGTVVLDASFTGELSGLRCAYALTEVTCDKHVQLPTMLIIGPDEDMKAKINFHISNAKRWVDLNSGKK